MALNLPLTTVISLRASDELFLLPPELSPPKHPKKAVLPSCHLQQDFPILSPWNSTHDTLSFSSTVFHCFVCPNNNSLPSQTTHLLTLLTFTMIPWSRNPWLQVPLAAAVCFQLNFVSFLSFIAPPFCHPDYGPKPFMMLVSSCHLSKGILSPAAFPRARNVTVRQGEPERQREEHKNRAT